MKYLTSMMLLQYSVYGFALVQTRAERIHGPNQEDQLKIHWRNAPPRDYSTSAASEFDAELEQAGNKLVVIVFTALWCGPCRAITPKFEKLADQIPDVVFLKVDVDEAPELSQHCGISAMPTFQFFKNKEKVAEILGANFEKLKATVAANK